MSTISWTMPKGVLSALWKANEFTEFVGNSVVFDTLNTAHTVKG